MLWKFSKFRYLQLIPTWNECEVAWNQLKDIYLIDAFKSEKFHLEFATNCNTRTQMFLMKWWSPDLAESQMTGEIETIHHSNAITAIF